MAPQKLAWLLTRCVPYSFGSNVGVCRDNRSNCHRGN
jgi:hypothetical protein